MKDQLNTEIENGDLVALTDSSHNLYTGTVTKVTAKVIHIGPACYRRPNGVIVLKKRSAQQ
jgi:hypothetical protein